MKQLALCSILLISFLISIACINEESITIDGRPVTMNFYEVPEGVNHKEMAKWYAEELKEKDSLWKTGGNIEDYSDYGVILIYLGRLEEAKRVFIEIESKHPGRYSTAANLGTTYELLGKNDSALLWIKRSVAIDPTSHYGSEWLHVNILEAKIASSKLNTLFLLGTDFGNDTIPRSNKSRDDLKKLSESVYFQLSERMSFVKPKDPIVGLLLFELGNIKAIESDLVSAMKNYELAIEYGHTGKLIETRYNEFRKRLIDSNVDNEFVKKLKSGKPFVATEAEVKVEAAAEKKSRVNSSLIYIILALAGIIAAVFFILKRKKA